MTVLSAEQLDEVRVTHHTIFRNVLERTPGWAKEVCTVVDSDSEENIYDWVEDTLVATEWIGEREMSAFKEYIQRVPNVLHQVLRKLNRRKIKTDKLKVFAEITLPMMARALEKAPDRIIANILLSNAQGAKGLHFSVAHANSTNLALNAANFETIRAAMRSRLDAGGNVIDIGEEFELWVAPSNEGNAKRIVVAETGAVVGDATGVSAENVNKGQASIRVIPELAANPNRWAVVAVGLPLKAFVMQELEASNLVIVDSPEADIVIRENCNLYSGTRDFMVAPTLPELIYLSDPDGAMVA
jgi:phage major head subunit gpT-like protein